MGGNNKIVQLYDRSTDKVLTTNDVERKPPQGYSNVADVKTFVATLTIPSLRLASPAGITSLAVSRTNPSQFLMGGNNKIVQLYDRSTDKVLTPLKGHTRKINHVSLREMQGESTLILSASADKIAKV
jgi:pre-mRNA-processing factor 19